jgi:hypothetical protein
MAARLGLSGHDRLQHFIASPAWDDAPPWRGLDERGLRWAVGVPRNLKVYGAFAWLRHLRLAAHRRAGTGKVAAPGSVTATIAKSARRPPRCPRTAVRPPPRTAAMSTLPAQLQTI